MKNLEEKNPRNEKSLINKLQWKILNSQNDFFLKYRIN